MVENQKMLSREIENKTTRIYTTQRQSGLTS